MDQMHSLLKRQLHKHFGDSLPGFPGWESFLERVNSAYEEFDTDRKMLERALEISSEEMLEINSQLNAAIIAFPDVFLLLDSRGIIRELKAGSTVELYIPEAQLLGRHIEVIHPDGSASPFAAAVEDVVNKNELKIIEYSVRRIEDEHFFEARLVPTLDGVFVVVRNVTVRRRMEERLRMMSMHDALTGLYNRAYFQLETAHLAKPPHRWIGLIVADVDGLKIVNDTLGHDVGDEMLIKAARVFKDSLRASEFIARIGGDEFAAILYDYGQEKLDNVMQRVRDNASLVLKANSIYPLSISLGSAFGNTAVTTIEELYKQADDNMYREKLWHRKAYYDDLSHSLMNVLFTRDFYIHGNVPRLQELVRRMAEALKLSEAQQASLQMLARFHNIGKVGITDEVLLKKEPLTYQERLKIEQHPESGYRIARSSTELMPVADLILTHHEWWNGRGYPSGLAGLDIPLEARILALADAYNAMTSARPYRSALSHDAAVAEIERMAGLQFDPELARLFLSLVK